MATLPRDDGTARRAGRVGGLAVALGVAAAIAHGPAVASADAGSSGKGPSAHKSSQASSHKPARKAKPAASAQRSPATVPARSATAAAALARRAQPVARGTVTAIAPVAPALPHPLRPAQSPTVLGVFGLARREADSGTPDFPVPAAVKHNAPAPTAGPVTDSPLATPQQLTAEQIAGRTVNTLPVQLMKVVLRAGFYLAAAQQFAGVGGVDQKNLDQLNAAVDEYAMGAAFQQQLLNSNAPTIVTQVAPPHTWDGQDVGGSRILYDNPDTVYRFIGVNSLSTYVITGKFADGQRPTETNFSVLTGLAGNTASNLAGGDLIVAPDGSFTITVSSAPGVPGDNHLQLVDGTTLIATRNTLSDWNTQAPMTLSIQRISGPPNSLFSQIGGFAFPGLGSAVAANPQLTALVSLLPPFANPPPLLRGLETAIVMALGISREAQYIAVATTDPSTGAPIAPNELKDPAHNAAFLATQMQSAGYFQLTDQQALILTIAPGNAGYFVVPVTNDWTITDNYWDEQTSLNVDQATPNSDGTYTIVISPTDPGVANWVSTGGLKQGTISIRFQDIDTSDANVPFPTVSSQLADLGQLSGALPPGTELVTSTQRQQQIALRQQGFAKRYGSPA